MRWQTFKPVRSHALDDADGVIFPADARVVGRLRLRNTICRTLLHTVHLANFSTTSLMSVSLSFDLSL